MEKPITEKIKELLKVFSATELAYKLKVTSATIYNWRNGVYMKYLKKYEKTVEKVNDLYNKEVK